MKLNIFVGTITNTKKSSAISGKMNIDGKAPYSFDAQLAKDVSGNTYIFQPSLEIQANKETHFTLKGMFSLKNWKQVDIQFDADGITKEPVSGKRNIYFYFWQLFPLAFSHHNNFRPACLVQYVEPD